MIYVVWFAGIYISFDVRNLKLLAGEWYYRLSIQIRRINHTVSQKSSVLLSEQQFKYKRAFNWRPDLTNTFTS